MDTRRDARHRGWRTHFDPRLVTLALVRAPDVRRADRQRRDDAVCCDGGNAGGTRRPRRGDHVVQATVRILGLRGHGRGLAHLQGVIVCAHV